jgi:phytoene synthase
LHLSTIAIYAFCRIADDAIDQGHAPTDQTLQHLRGILQRAYAGTPRHTNDTESAVERALSRVLRVQRIPATLFDALIEGFVWDARHRRYETLDELYAYAARVAGTVGAMMTVIMGVHAPGVLARACDLGVAMQLTNIARDVGEDARNGRIYLPLAWLREEGIDPDAWLQHPMPTAAVRRVVARLLAHAEPLYCRGDLGITSLPSDCRVAIRAARLVYAEIGAQVRRSHYDSVTTRAVVPRWRKVWLLARALGARFWRTPRPDGPNGLLARAPPLDPARFLIAACDEATP